MAKGRDNDDAGHGKPPGRHLRAAEAPEYTPEERRIAAFRIGYLQALAALQENDPGALDFLNEVFAAGQSAQ
jgi:hypothetical protein